MLAMQGGYRQLREAADRDRQRGERRRNHGRVDRSSERGSHDAHVGNGQRDRADDPEQAPLPARTQAVEAEGTAADGAMSTRVCRSRH
jgi:hypothetical protein